MSKLVSGKSWFVNGLLLALAALTAVKVYQSDTVQASRRLPAELAAAKQEGLLVVFPGAQRGIHDDLSNAAPIYRMVLLESQTRYREALTTIHADQNAASDRGSDQALSEVQPLLRDLALGARRPSLAFDLRSGDRFLSFAPECSMLLGLGQVVRYDVARRLDRGDMAGALDEAETLLRMASQFNEQPSFVGLLVASQIRSDVAELVERAISEHGRDAEVRRRIRSVVSLIGPTPDLRRALRMELPRSLAAIDAMGSLDPSTVFGTVPGAVPASAKLARFGVVRDAYQSRLVEYWRMVYRELPKDRNDFLGASDVVRRAKRILDSHPVLGGALDSALVSISDGAIMNLTRAEAHKRVIESALDILDRKEVQLPNDPFTNRPLCTARKNGRMIVFSVGHDQFYEAGVSGTSALNPPEIVLIMPRQVH